MPVKRVKECVVETSGVWIWRRLAHEHTGDPLVDYHGKVPGGIVAPGQSVKVSVERANQLMRDFPAEWTLTPPADDAFVVLPENTDEEALIDLQAISGLGEQSAARLLAAGFRTRHDVLDPNNREKVEAVLPRMVFRRIFPTSVE